MYLKSIEIHGFKSFANKLVFEFQKGITAIVGPNGSGKSNVGDAVRWVLGEQSAKQLRGAKMEDIIFAGTELRKPQGFAYVAITFDNSDHKLPTSYEEVTVARRVYRSGESEYLMNGVNCRLRDVQELFLDTGIGKEGYSIIGQGQIDKILNGKPEERRELFDEAAGIVKYKKRKATAEKNLEVERQNLERIQDILSELEKQVGPLKEQAETARIYLHLREEMRKIDVNLFLTEQEYLQEEEKKLEENISIVTDDYGDKEKQLEDLKEKYTQIEKQLEQQDCIIQQNRENVNVRKLEKEKKDGAIKVCQQQILTAQQKDAHYQQRLEETKVEIEKKQEEKESCKEEKKNLEAKLKDIQEKKSSIENQLLHCQEESKLLNRKIDLCNEHIMDQLGQNASLKGNLEKYNALLEQCTVKKAELTQRILKGKTEEAICDDTIVKEEKRLAEISLQQKQEKEKLNGLEETFSSETKKLNEMRQAYQQMQQQYHGEKSRLETLRNLTERYDGYGQSIRRVMEQKERNPGIIGVVADIIKVKKEYEIAMEIALGGSIQNIVTDNENTAKQLIGFLKKNKFGRATFLPLTTINRKGTFHGEAALKEPGVLGLASNLVEADAKYENLVTFLLGRILVVDHIEHAIAVAKKYNHSFRIVTIEGELLNPGGSMSGGAYKNTSNLLSRRRDMKEGEEQVQNMEKEIAKAKAQIENVSDNLNHWRQQIENLQKKLQQYTLEENTAKFRCNQAKERKDEIVLGYQSTSLETSNLESQIVEYKSTIAALEDKMHGIANTNQDREDEIANYNTQLAKQKKAEEEIRETLEENIRECMSLEQKVEFSEMMHCRVVDEIVHLQDNLKEFASQAHASAGQVEEKEQEIKQLQEQMVEEEKEIESLMTYVDELVKQRESTSLEHKKMLHEREQFSGDLTNLDKELFRLNNRKEKVAEQMENRKNYMWEEYELTTTTALEYKKDLGMDLPEMKKEITGLKSKIKALGDVNVNAIEDYRNVSERYELLHGQHEDLIHSEEVLLGIVEELDHEMRKQFEEKFAEIKTQFDIVFRELFGGGKGTIQLVDDEDVLEAGIRIIAQPPGKKLQNMMQMSGGEKALTAISLLFAIQNLKPSPFCLLDEIEAALDDSNVKRYAQYLHKLTKDTQFIVITHRRGTMSAADVMYGITMQEKGISTMVSVNLIEDQLEDAQIQEEKV